MKTFLATACMASVLACSGAPSLAQAPEPHRIHSVLTTPEGLPLLTLEGRAATAFRSYFDLFRLEASANLGDWTPLATVIRTNAATHAPAFLDRTAAGHAHRFYRTPSNQVLTPFLPPTGPHPVGVCSRLLTDSSRSNRFGIRTNSSFMVTFWHPAPSSGDVLAPYMDRLLAERQAYWGAATDAVPDLVQFAVADTPPAAAPGGFPVVLYSHGLGDQQGRAVRTENTAMAVELASHGYVVVAVDHTDAYGVVLPPDQLLLGRNVWSFNFLPDRLRDIGLLLDHLEQLNADDPVFRGRLDLDRIGIMGWSFGGGTAGEACRLQERLKAAVLLDGYLGHMPTLLSRGLAKPFLAMVSPDSGLGGDITTLFNRSPTNVYQLAVRGASHEAFTDNVWIVSPTTTTRRRALAMHACLVSFFNRHLKGTDDSLLGNPGAFHPDVISFRRK